jgi:hypothetical protein
MLSHGISTQMSFCLGTPKWESQNSHTKSLKQISSRTFQRSFAHHLRTKKLGRFPTFSGQESNCQFDFHYNNRGLFCNSNIIANNKERSFQKPALANHNSSQTLKLLRYHNIRTRTIASPSQLRNFIQSQNFSIVTISIHCLRLTLHQKLFATHPSPQRLSELIQKSIGFRYKI